MGNVTDPRHLEIVGGGVPTHDTRSEAAPEALDPRDHRRGIVRARGHDAGGALEQVRPGVHFGVIGAAIQKYAEGNGYSVVREFCGHGIGRQFHEEPQILHYGKPGTLEKLAAGMIFTIEPMINAGRREIKELADGWTIVTKDHSLSAQWEHTVLVTDSGYEVLTVSAGTPAMPDRIRHAA